MKKSYIDYLGSRLNKYNNVKVLENKTKINEDYMVKIKKHIILIKKRKRNVPQREENIV